jgi:DNA-binding transcriptional MocR family regulator
MPVNSFEDYPMNWKPDKERLKYPYYLSLAEQLEQDIKNGILQENSKLPPQRELADYWGINLSTITRTYKLCEKRGLIYATVGKGTFVSPHIGVQTTVVSRKDETGIEMGMVFPFDEDNHIVREVASELLAKPSAEQYFEYRFPLGSPFQRNMMKKWLEDFGCSVDTDHILITLGAQNALSRAFSLPEPTL